MNALGALRSVDFQWAARLSDVWSDPAWDVADLHADVRREFADRLEMMTRSAGSGSPLGWVILGRGGTGKTHLLGALRREAVRQNAAFVLVDMTDVHDFWETVRLGYIDSLQRSWNEGAVQHQSLVSQVVERLPRKQTTDEIIDILSRQRPDTIGEAIQRVLRTLARFHRAETLRYEDAIRALICLNCQDDSLCNLGYSWLLSQGLDDDVMRQVGFHRAAPEPLEVIRALSWFMSLSGPTVLAFDQLDPIVTQQSLKAHDDRSAAEQASARAIIGQIGGGLGALRDATRNTLAVVSCLEESWDVLQGTALKTYLDRFEEPARLRPMGKAEIAESLVRERLTAGYSTAEFTPEYPTWPFQAELFATVQNDSPRELLRKCSEHIRNCVRTGAVTEIDHFGDVAPPPVPLPQSSRLDQLFEKARADCVPAQLVDEEQEDQHLAQVLRSALFGLLEERPLPARIGAEVDTSFARGQNLQPLHARLRLVFHDENEREEHFCVRAIERTNAIAFQGRIRAVLIQSGIDGALGFRHLAVVRTRRPPSGKRTSEIIEAFQKAGGRFVTPTEDELRTLFAVHHLMQQHDPEFEMWLRDRQPLSKLALMRALVPSPWVFPNKATAASSVAGQGTSAFVCTHESNASVSNKPLAKEELKEASGRTDLAAERPSPSEATRSAESASQKPEPRSSDSLSPGGGGLGWGGESTEMRSRLPHPGLPSEVGFQPATWSVPGKLEAYPTEPPPGVRGPEPGRSGNVTSPPFPLGRRLISGKAGEPVTMPMDLLEKHTVVLAGSGAGKTVLLRRLIEEAVLRGVPAVVVDGAGDLATLDEPWPEPPPGWQADDLVNADAYFRSLDVVVWTPSRELGNPLAFEPLPDFRPVMNDPDELEAAVAMAREALVPVVAPGDSQSAKNKAGVLSHALRYFAEYQDGGRLADFLALLDDLPADAALGVTNEPKLARQMADLLRSAIETNPLLRSSGTALDPAILFGDDQPGTGRTRVSLISLSGLAGLEAQRAFVNQLAMTLFSWIKRNPGPRGLRGLLVIDEARDLVPSQRASICKESLVRLTAQARKYHLGLVFATQAPKDLDTKIIGNCSTHYYGRLSAPEHIATVRELIAQKGGSGDDVPRLEKGQFYVHNADAHMAAPIRVHVPMCLSHHHGAIEETALLSKAVASRARIQPS